MVKTKTKRKSKQKTLKHKKIQKGGVSYKIGEVVRDRYGNIEGKVLSNNFELVTTELGAKSILPFLNILNLDMVSTYPNKDPNFIYHSLFMAQLEDYQPTHLETINWSMEKFRDDVLSKLNADDVDTNPNKIKYGKKDIKVYNFKLDINNEAKKVNMKGDVYVTDVNRLNKQIDRNVFNKLPSEVSSIVKQNI
jgi:hypothetical protein